VVNPVPQPTPPLPNVAVICPDVLADRYREPLRTTCHVVTTALPDAAIGYLRRSDTQLLVFDFDGEQQESPAIICARVLQAVPQRPASLVAVPQPEAAGRFIDLCDSILVKPFSPNLLTNRVGRLLELQRKIRLLRAGSDSLRIRVDNVRLRVQHLMERRGTLLEWSDTQCAYCSHTGVVMFDYAAHRRAWYACKACRKVWLARRRDELSP